MPEFHIGIAHSILLFLLRRVRLELRFTFYNIMLFENEIKGISDLGNIYSCKTMILLTLVIELASLFMYVFFFFFVLFVCLFVCFVCLFFFFFLCKSVISLSFVLFLSTFLNAPACKGSQWN